MGMGMGMGMGMDIIRMDQKKRNKKEF